MGWWNGIPKQGPPKAVVPPPEPPKPGPKTVERKEITYRVHLNWAERPYWDIVCESYDYSFGDSEFVYFYETTSYKWMRVNRIGGAEPAGIGWTEFPDKRETIVSIRRGDIRAIETFITGTTEVPCD